MTLDNKYGVPTVALHTHVFEKVVESVNRVHGMPRAPRAFVPQPVMGKTAAQLRAYIDGKDPLSGRPVMQEVIEGLTQPIDDSGVVSEKFAHAATPRLVDADSEENLQQLFLDKNWTDKLPIVLPTEKRVAGNARPHQPQARRSGRSHALDPFQRILGVHGGKSRGQRGDGRRPAGIFSGDPGACVHRRHRPRQHVQLGSRHGAWSTDRFETKLK